jgi:mRNA-degrading endonuclease RelE of RelBE toxin-antitoxin system
MPKLTYHPRVSDDLDALPRSTQKRVMRAIDEKLTTDPTHFGKPLRHILRRYYSLRVGEYRVIYIMNGEHVFVVMIRHRKDVYVEAVKRAGRMG